MDNIDRFLFMADSHIKDRTWTNNCSLSGDAYHALLKARQGKGDISTLVIGGDWFDSGRPSSMDVVATGEFFSYFRNVYYVRGNHDRVVPSFLDGLDGKHCRVQRPSAEEVLDDLDGKPCRVQLLSADEALVPLAPGYWLSGTSWTHLGEELLAALAKAVEQLPPGDVLYFVMHASFKHLLGFDGASQLSLDQVATICGDKQVRLLVGDIHLRDTTCYGAEGQWLHSPGSLYPLSWDKTSVPCSVSIVHLDGRIDDLDTTVRSYHSLDYTSREVLEQDIARITAESRRELPPFVRLALPAGYDGAPVLPGDFPSVVLNVDQEAVSGPATGMSAASRQAYTLDQALEDELLEVEKDPDLVALGKALLSSADPVKEIEEWLNTWKVERA